MKSNTHKLHQLINMIMSKKQTIYTVAITVLFIITCLAVQAQPGGGGGGIGIGGPPPGGGGGGGPIPIDGGAILLAIGAAAYGRKVLGQQANKSN